MKWPATLFLVAILLSAAIQPIGEFANILREKVVLNAALINSGRAARNNAISIWHMMNFEAYINEADYIQLFSDALSESLDLSHDYNRNTNTDNRVTYASNNDRFNDITIHFAFQNTTYSGLNDADIGITNYHDRPVTLVTVTMETPYLFRTFWLRSLNGISNDDYLLMDTRKFLVQIVN